MSESRTKKTSRNVFVGIMSRFIIMAFAFPTKTLFIRLLGDEYNGIYGLYSNILAVLALSELGVENVFNYALYSALRKNNTEKVKALVCYFRKIYYGIALAITVIGLMLIPFLRFIINSDLPHDELIIYYILYLVNSMVSYLVAYKTTVTVADQNNYISSICEMVTAIIMYLLQIIYLVVFKDFLGYLIILVSCTILKNAMLNYYTNKKYPYLKHLDGNKQDLVNDEKNKIVDNIKSTFLYKIASVLLNNTNNILISVIVGTVFVGYYSNYYMIVTYITTFVGIFINGITASLGNLNSENNSKLSFNMFNILSLIFSFIATIEVCCLLNCFQQFIPIWIGEEHVMDFSWVIVISANLYLNTVTNPIWMFRETMGLFRQVRFIMLITAALNIIFSIVLGNIFGVPGILAAPAVAKILSQYWYEPVILYGKFRKPVRLFYFNQIKQVIVMLLAAASSLALCSFIGNNILGVVFRAMVSMITAVFIVCLFNCKSEAMAHIINRYLKPNIQRLTGKLSRRK